MNEVVTNRAAVAVVLIAVGYLPPFAFSQDEPASTRTQPQVDIVQTVGCVERRGGNMWLAGASDPAVIGRGVFNETQVEEARKTAPGTGAFQLIGEAEFLSAEGLLRTAERAVFTTPEQVNATGGLREGRRVLVKGLLIDTERESRINLLAVVALSETCSE